MKRTILLALMASAFSGALVFAEDVELAGKVDGDAGPSIKKEWHHGGGCRFELSDEQRSKMKAERFKFADEQIDRQAELKHAKLAYKKLMMDPKTDYKSAKSASEEIVKLQAKMLAAKANLRTEIAFKVLTAEQREKAGMCHGAGGPHGRRGHGKKGFAEEEIQGGPEVAANDLLNENDESEEITVSE